MDGSTYKDTKVPESEIIRSVDGIEETICGRQGADLAIGAGVGVKNV